jgi:hypothetical protein
MCKRALVIFCAVILLATLAGCGGDDGPHQRANDLTVYNDASLSISELYLTPANQSSWGANQLNLPIPSGSSYTMTNITSDIYDLKAVIVGSLSTYYGYIYDMALVDGRIYDLSVQDADFSGSLEIINDTVGASIEAIYVSPTGSASWGPNQITSRIGPGLSTHLYDLPADSYDVLIVWNRGPDSEYSRIIVSPLTLLTLKVY